MSDINLVSFVWGTADLLRGPFKQHQYGDIILPFTVLRRLDAVLAPTKDVVLGALSQAHNLHIPVDAGWLHTFQHPYSFWNASPSTLADLPGDPENLAENLKAYVRAFSPNVRDVFEKYDFADHIEELDANGLLLLVLQRFAKAPLGPDSLSDTEMGDVFEELIRRFAESSNETAGEHFTPREVIGLMVDLLLDDDTVDLSQPGLVRTVYDPAAGTGGMLSVADQHLREANPDIDVSLFGQEINPQSYAIGKANMIIKGQDADSMYLGDTLDNDHWPTRHFSYCLSNPPFGSDWKRERESVETEHLQLGFSGRFGAGLPAVSDGSMLFLQHLISKLSTGGSGSAPGRGAIVLSGSALFTGGAGSGPSDIRRWILNEDLLEAIIALPGDMFYNTGISTYIWVLARQKSPERQGKVQLIDARQQFVKMRKSKGAKRNELSADDIAHIVQWYGEFEDTEGQDDDHSRILPADAFKYRLITVERPLRLDWSTARVDDALASRKLAKLSEDVRARLREAIGGLDATVESDERAFRAHVQPAIGAAGIALTMPQMNTLFEGMSADSEDGAVQRDRKGRPKPSKRLRDTERVPWDEDVDAYFEREVKPWAPDAWIDRERTKEGAEIPFTRIFYKYQPPRPLENIDRDLGETLDRLTELIRKVRA